MKVRHEDFRQMAKILIGSNDDAKLSNEISGKLLTSRSRFKRKLNCWFFQHLTRFLSIRLSKSRQNWSGERRFIKIRINLWKLSRRYFFYIKNLVRPFQATFFPIPIVQNYKYVFQLATHFLIVACLYSGEAGKSEWQCLRSCHPK